MTSLASPLAMMSFVSPLARTSFKTILISGVCLCLPAMLYALKFSFASLKLNPGSSFFPAPLTPEAPFIIIEFKLILSPS